MVGAAWLGHPPAAAAPAAEVASASTRAAVLVVSVDRSPPPRERERLSIWPAVRLARPEVIVVDHIVRPEARH